MLRSCIILKRLNKCDPTSSGQTSCSTSTPTTRPIQLAPIFRFLPRWLWCLIFLDFDSRLRPWRYFEFQKLGQKLKFSLKSGHNFFRVWLRGSTFLDSDSLRVEIKVCKIYKKMPLGTSRYIFSCHFTVFF